MIEDIFFIWLMPAIFTSIFYVFDVSIEEDFDTIAGDALIVGIFWPLVLIKLVIPAFKRRFL